MIELPPIPKRLAGRPRDERGYVISFVTYVDTHGKPDFRVVDEARRQYCLRLRLCGMCGGLMGRHLYFIGGDLSVRNRFFHDPPMHKDCAIFALQACPHLASSKGRFSKGADLPADAHVVVAEHVSAEKCAWFGLCHTTRYSSERGPDGMTIIHAGEWLDVQRWRDGAPIPEEATA